MFKKRAPKTPPLPDPTSRRKDAGNTSDGDAGSSSPTTITVSIPKDAFNSNPAATAASTTIPGVPTPALPAQGWNPSLKDPSSRALDSTGEGASPGVDVSSKVVLDASASPNSSTLTATSPPSLLSSSTSSPSIRSTSSGMMQNLTGLFAGPSGGNGGAQSNSKNSSKSNSRRGSPLVLAPGTPQTGSSPKQQLQQQQQQANVEAKLWNVESYDSPPMSPARYIPAIAGGIESSYSRTLSKSSMSFKARSGTIPGVTPGGGGGKGVTQRSGSASLVSDASTTTFTSNRPIQSPESNPSSQPTKGQQRPLWPSPRQPRPGNDTSEGSIQTSRVSETSGGGGMKFSGERSSSSSSALQSGFKKSKNITAKTGSSSNLPSYPPQRRPDRNLVGEYNYDQDDQYSDFGKDSDERKKQEHGKHGYIYGTDRGRGRPDSRMADMDESFPFSFTRPQRMLRRRLLFCMRRRVHPVIRLILLVFLAGSVCFTTFRLLFGDGSEAARRIKSFDYSEQQLRLRRILGEQGLEMDKERKRAPSVFDVEAQNYSIHQWALDSYDINQSKAVVRISEDYMLSKAFSTAMFPTRVLPFYFRASFRDENEDDDLHLDDDDFIIDRGSEDPQSSSWFATSRQPDPLLVTITTLITPDRYGVFLKLVKQYRGPISVATHIRKGEDQDARFDELHSFFRENPILRKYVDLHVIVDGIDYQLNMWRNVARMFARTDYFMMLDVDFFIPSGFKDRLHHDPRNLELLASGAALVVPAFEYKLDKDPKNSKFFPDSKQDLLPLLEKGHVHVFHDSFPPGHAATETPRWTRLGKRTRIPIVTKEEGVEGDGGIGDGGSEEMLIRMIQGAGREEYMELEAEPEQPYKVTKFEPKYEPYIILKKEGSPWCDERFVGYGANKAACLYEIYISGVDFWVMPHDFLIHQYHDYPTTNRKNGRILNKQLFVTFQQEVCYRVLERMIRTGEWYTDQANNLRQQCSGFDGFLKSADEMAADFERLHPNSLLKDPILVPNTKRDKKKSAHAKDKSGSSGSSWPHWEQGQDRGRSWGSEHERGSSGHPAEGKVWGGITPKTFYVPPIEDEELDVTEKVLNFESQQGEGKEGEIKDGDGQVVADGIYRELEPGKGDGGHVDKLGGDGKAIHDGENNGHAGLDHGNGLMGERLERFREGIILPD